jgi:hypothetical protein
MGPRAGFGSIKGEEYFTRKECHLVKDLLYAVSHKTAMYRRILLGIHMCVCDLTKEVWGGGGFVTIESRRQSIRLLFSVSIFMSSRSPLRGRPGRVDFPLGGIL